MGCVINKNKLFSVAVNDISLKIEDLVNITNYYEACCTAEYIMENDDYNFNGTEEEAIALGYEVRECMDKYNLDEAEAIENVLEDHGIEQSEERD